MLVVKNPPVNAGDVRDVGSIPGSERSPGGGHGNPLQYSCLENPMDWGASWATVHRVAKGQTRLKWLSMHTRLIFGFYNMYLASLVAQLVKNPRAVWETWVWSLGWEDPLEEFMATHSSIFAWRLPMDRGAWRATVLRVTKSQTRLKQLSTRTQ